MHASTVRPVCPSAPRCMIVTGPRRAGKTRWLQETVHALRAGQPSARCAVLTVKDSMIGVDRSVQNVPGGVMRRLFLPCSCCSAAVDLPRHVLALAQESGADWLFVELPVLSAINLIAEFDTLVRWPREVVVCLNADWAKARHTGTLSYFQVQLLGAADRVIEAPAGSVIDDRHAGLRACAPDTVLDLTLA